MSEPSDSLTIVGHCPECGEPQPDPVDASDLWEPRQLRIASGQRRECVACDAVFLVHAEPRASVIYADCVINGRLPKRRA